MRRLTVSRTMISALLAVVATSSHAQAPSAPSPYPNMAPIEQYLIADRNAEIALARTAAPASISRDAEVMVLGRNGFEVAVQGTNHFVCMVQHAWDAAIGDPEFWNPKNRSPICFNPAAASSYLPITLLRARLVLAGKTQAQIGEALQVAFDQNKLPPLEPGAMCYMMSKQQYLNDSAGNWHPHLMFFVPMAMAKTWGANLDGSPVLASDDASDRLTIFMVPVVHWSDGSLDAGARN